MELIYALLNIKKDLVKKRGDAQISKKLDEFEQLLSENDALTDDEINLSLYGKRNLSPTYYSLKYRMEERLMNEVFMLCSLEQDLESKVKSSLQIEKITQIAIILQKNFFRRESIILFEKAYKLSNKYSAPDLAVRQLTNLMSYYSFVKPDQKKMKFTMKELDYNLDLYQAEIYVKKCNSIFSNLYVTNKGGLNQKQLKEMKEMVIKMQEIKTKFKSNYIVSFVNDLTFFYYQSIGDYKKGLEIATKGLEENEALPNKELLGIFQSKQNIATANLCLKNYVEANKWFLEIIEMVTFGSRNWFHATSLYYLSLIGNRDYNRLYELSVKILTNKNLSKFPLFQEQWILREAYLHFLIRLGKIDLPKDEKQGLKPFSLTKFMNSVPFHTKDKSGQNITILVIQILFLLLDNKYNKIIDKMESLNQYTYRYLHKDETFRSNCFIKMLLLMIKADFHPARTVALTSDLMKKLKNSHLITDEKSTQVEIIPYDYLWELIIEILKDKQKK